MNHLLEIHKKDYVWISYIIEKFLISSNSNKGFPMYHENFNERMSISYVLVKFYSFLQLLE